MSYIEWEDEIISKLEVVMEITRSDAQGIVGARNFEMMQEWTKGSTPEQAADRIAKL